MTNRTDTDPAHDALWDAYRERLNHDESIHAELSDCLTRIMSVEARLTEFDGRTNYGPVGGHQLPRKAKKVKP